MTAFVCMRCRATFSLTGSTPRLTLAGVVLVRGEDREEIRTPEGAQTWAICPDCAVEHAASLAVLEAAVRP